MVFAIKVMDLCCLTKLVMTVDTLAGVQYTCSLNLNSFLYPSAHTHYDITMLLKICDSKLTNRWLFCTAYN